LTLSYRFDYRYALTDFPIRADLKRFPNFGIKSESQSDLCVPSDSPYASLICFLAKKANRRRLGAGFDMRNALDWSRLEFAARKQRFETVLADFLIKMGGISVGTPADGTPAVVAAIERTRLLWCVHAISATTSIAAARELVGQPFICDHLTVPLLAKNRAAGPVHLVGCHKGITEEIDMS
jgi:hypothetical protein